MVTGDSAPTHQRKFVNPTNMCSLGKRLWLLNYAKRHTVLKKCKKKKKKKKKHLENADTSTSLTLTCDLDLTSRSRKPISLDVTYCIVPLY